MEWNFMHWNIDRTPNLRYDPQQEITITQQVCALTGYPREDGR